MFTLIEPTAPYSFIETRKWIAAYAEHRGKNLTVTQTKVAARAWINRKSGLGEGPEFKTLTHTDPTAAKAVWHLLRDLNNEVIKSNGVPPTPEPGAGFVEVRKWLKALALEQHIQISNTRLNFIVQHWLKYQEHIADGKPLAWNDPTVQEVLKIVDRLTKGVAS